MQPGRELICAYDVLEWAQGRFKRDVKPDPWCKHGEFYYFSRTGSVRQVDTSDGSIWACDHERGPFYMKKVRTVKGFKK